MADKVKWFRTIGRGIGPWHKVVSELVGGYYALDCGRPAGGPTSKNEVLETDGTRPEGKICVDCRVRVGKDVQP